MANPTETLTNCLQQKVTVFSDDHISKHIRKYGLHERQKLEVFNAILSRYAEPVVLDIGANILCRAALDDEFADASGKYYDNDAGRFAPPNTAAGDAAHCAAVMQGIEEILAGV